MRSTPPSLHPGPVTLLKIVRCSHVSSLALLVVALGVGVPIQGHSHHTGDELHIGPPSHAHGMALVQHEMRLERAAAPVFVAPEAQVEILPAPAAVTVGWVPASDECICESRAPPTARPRAPPI